MAPVFVIEDAFHAEWMGQFATLAEAWDTLVQWSTQPWDEPPNAAPCSSSRTCGRNLQVIAFDDSVEPWIELRRIPAYDVDCEAVRWHSPRPPDAG